MIKKRQAKHVRSYLETSLLKRKRRRRRLLLRASLATFALLVLAGIVFLLRTEALQVKSVEASGTIQLARADIEAKASESIASSRHLFGLIPSSNSLLVDEERIERDISEGFPAVLEVHAHTSLGGKVRIDVSERGTVAFWCDEGGESCFQMDADGFLFAPAPMASGTADKLVFKGMLDQSAATHVGQKFLSGKEIRVFSDARDLLAKKSKSVDYVRCDSGRLCMIKVADNGVLKVDPEDDLENALDRLAAALQAPVFAKGRFDYIDLRYGNKLFYKLAGGDAPVEKNLSSTSSPDR